MPKKVLILCFSFLSFTLFAENVWQQIPSPVSYPNALTKVIFKDSLTGWASGDSGFIIHTSDGGINWIFQKTGISSKIWDMFFLDKMRGWAISYYSEDTTYGSYILSTKDGGNNWNRDSLLFPKEYLRKIYFYDSLKGFVSGSNSPIFYSVNGGLTWSKANTDSFSTYPGGGFSFHSENTGIAYGGILDIMGVIWKTTDGGFNWRGMDIGSLDPIREMHYFDSLNVLGIGGDAEYGMARYFSSDGGDSWTSENLSLLAFPLNLSFRTKSEVWIPLGFVTDSLFFSNDSGLTWRSYPVPNSLYINDVSFPDSMHGYAVGMDGVIFKYKPSPNLIIDNILPNINFELLQNYPNPFNSGSEIYFNIPGSGIVELIVYDVLGRKIKTLFYGLLDKGNHKINFDAGNLPSGVYFYKLTSGNFSSVKKAVLIK